MPVELKSRPKLSVSQDRVLADNLTAPDRVLGPYGLDLQFGMATAANSTMPRIPTR